MRSVGVSTMRQSAIELARKQLSAHDPEKGHRVDLMTGVNRQAGQQIGEQHSSVPTHTPEPEKTPRVGVERDLGGPGLGLPGFEVCVGPTHLHIPHMAEKMCRG